VGRWLGGVIAFPEGPGDLRLNCSEEAPRVSPEPQRAKQGAGGLLHMEFEGANPMEPDQLGLDEASVGVFGVVTGFME